MNCEALRASFDSTRAASLAYCAPLQREDYLLQAAEFASPPKWHLAHTTWFFETFVLKPFLDGYASPEPLYEVLFNSYYNGIGTPHPRGQRGLLSRPSLEEVCAYREYVDAGVRRLLAEPHPDAARIHERVTLGVEHERQHQELFFTDLKYSLAANPLLPAYGEGGDDGEAGDGAPMSWTAHEGAMVTVGFAGEGFAFDNETPRHRRFLEPFALADRLVTNGEYQTFVDDGGYRRPDLWLADGWTLVSEEGWQRPLHWHDRDGEALEYTLYGLRPRVPREWLRGRGLRALGRCPPSLRGGVGTCRCRTPRRRRWRLAGWAPPTPCRPGCGTDAVLRCMLAVDPQRLRALSRFCAGTGGHR